MIFQGVELNIFDSNCNVFVICQSTPLQIQGMICLSHIFEFSCLSVECPNRHIAGFRCLFQGYFLTAPCFVYLIEIIRQGQRWSAKFDALRFGSGNFLGLALFDICTLVFCHKGQHLQHNIGEECTHQIFASAGV